MGLGGAWRLLGEQVAHGIGALPGGRLGSSPLMASASACLDLSPGSGAGRAQLPGSRPFALPSRESESLGHEAFSLIRHVSWTRLGIRGGPQTLEAHFSSVQQMYLDTCPVFAFEDFLEGRGGWRKRS